MFEASDGVTTRIRSFGVFGFILLAGHLLGKRQSQADLTALKVWAITSKPSRVARPGRSVIGLTGPDRAFER